MCNIVVGRYTYPDKVGWQGWMEPEDKSWIVFVRIDGQPVIYLNRDENSIFIADKANGEPIEDGGKFFLIPTEDLMADRDVKSVEKIEVFTLKKEPNVNLILPE